MERIAWWWLLESIWAWCRYRVLRRPETTFLSPNICLLSRLSREVRFNSKFTLMIHFWQYYRVLLSSIRSMGSCPCPRCLVPKNSTDQLGTKSDQRQRVSLAREDNLQYRVKISNAREIIYAQNRTVDSNFVDNILFPESLVPTEVFLIPIFINSSTSNLPLAECILSATF